MAGIGGNWPPARPVVRFRYLGMGNDVYRVEGAEVLDAPPNVPAAECALMDGTICVQDVVESLGLEYAGVWAGCAEASGDGWASFTAWRVA